MFMTETGRNARISLGGFLQAERVVFTTLECGTNCCVSQIVSHAKMVRRKEASFPEDLLVEYDVTISHEQALSPPLRSVPLLLLISCLSSSTV